MTPLVVIALIEQAIRLVNNIIEGTPMEQRRAIALAAGAMLKPLVWPFLPDETKAEIDKLKDPT